MTATDCAPASTTAAARASVMPPMATSGSPWAVACAAAAVTRSRPSGSNPVFFVAVP